MMNLTIHTIPTKKAEIVFDTVGDRFEFSQDLPMETTVNVKPHHIHLTSDEVMYDEDYCLNTASNVIFQNDVSIYGGISPSMKHIRKIVGTNDPTLMYMGEQDANIPDISFEDLYQIVNRINNYRFDAKCSDVKICTQTGVPCGTQCYSEEVCNENIVPKLNSNGTIKLLWLVEPPPKVVEKMIERSKKNILNSLEKTNQEIWNNGNGHHGRYNPIKTDPIKIKAWDIKKDTSEAEIFLSSKGLSTKSTHTAHYGGDNKSVIFVLAELLTEFKEEK